jgi:hypothetical protein
MIDSLVNAKVVHTNDVQVPQAYAILENMSTKWHEIRDRQKERDSEKQTDGIPKLIREKRKKQRDETPVPTDETENNHDSHEIEPEPRVRHATKHELRRVKQQNETPLDNKKKSNMSELLMQLKNAADTAV